MATFDESPVPVTKLRTTAQRDTLGGHGKIQVDNGSINYYDFKLKKRVMAKKDGDAE